MSEKSQPIYVNGLIIREHVFQNGGSILKVSVNSEKMKTFLDANTKQSGWCNIIITRKKNQGDEKSGSHYATLDRWEPGAKAYTGQPRRDQPYPTKPKTLNPHPQPDMDSDTSSDVPF